MRTAQAVLAAAALGAALVAPAPAYADPPCHTIVDAGSQAVAPPWAALDIVSADVSLTDEISALTVRVRDLADRPGAKTSTVYSADLYVGADTVTVEIGSGPDRWVGAVSSTATAGEGGIETSAWVDEGANAVTVKWRTARVLREPLDRGATYDVFLRARQDVRYVGYTTRTWDAIAGTVVAGRVTCALHGPYAEPTCEPASDFTGDEGHPGVSEVDVLHVVDQPQYDLVGARLAGAKEHVVATLRVRDVGPPEPVRAPNYRVAVHGADGWLVLDASWNGTEFVGRAWRGRGADRVDVPVQLTVDFAADTLVWRVPATAIPAPAEPSGAVRYSALAEAVYRLGVAAAEYGYDTTLRGWWKANAPGC